MRYLTRNRITRGGGTPSSSGGEDPGTIASYSTVVSLTTSFEILQVLDETTLQISTNEIAHFPLGRLALVNASSGANNDGLYQVLDRSVVGELMTVSFAEANFDLALSENGRLHIEKHTTIPHNLDSEDIVYRIKNTSGGTSTTIEDDSRDPNRLLLKPVVPVIGDFRVSIFATK